MKTARLSIAAVLLCLVSSVAFSAQFRLDNWKHHNSFLDVRSADIDAEGNIWCGTSGGVYVYDQKNDTYRIYNNINGLLSIDITMVKYNPGNGAVYIGSNDGYIDIYTKEGKWVHVTDISSSPNTIKQIRDIEFFDGLAYIATSFGLTVLDTDENVFIETIQKVSHFAANPIVNDLQVNNDTLWIATELGLAACPLSKSLSVPDNWKTYSFPDNGGDGRFSSIVKVKDSLYFAADSVIYKLSSDTLEMHKSLANWEVIDQLLNVNDTLYWTIKFYIMSEKTTRYNLFDYSKLIQQVYYMTYEGKPFFVLAYSNAGMAILTDTIIYRIPDSPASNDFMSMDVDKNGNLWVASGQRGVLKYDGSLWKSFKYRYYDKDTTLMDYREITAASDGRIIAGTWGQGFSVFYDTDSIPSVYHYSNLNTPLTCPGGNPEYYIVSLESAVDSKGVLWIVNYGKEKSGPVLVAGKDDTWYPFVNKVNQSDRYFVCLAVDNYGTKWIGSQDKGGLYYFNERGTLDDASDDKYGAVTSSNGLADNAVNDIVLDKNGLLWAGTAGGLNYIASTYNVLSGSKITARQPVPKLLREVAVNCLLVDAVNNLWIGTENGLFIMDDEQNLIGNYTIGNSPLISNRIFSLAHNPEDGTVYIGTDKGMTEVRSLSVKPLETYDIKTYPQPFDPLRDTEMRIEGLAENTSIRILKVNGEFVRALETTSKVVIWDGKDDNGHYVATGVYLIVGSSESNGNGTVAKIAVIRNN